MRKILIVGNWKMNLNVSEASLLVQRLHDRIKIHHDVDVVLAPPFIDLQPISLQIDHRKFRLAAQNAYFKDQGAYTGEVSFTMLRELVGYCIIGHSERRLYFDESLEMIRDKVAAAVRNEIVPILCIGETSREREAGETNQVLHDQLTTAVSNLTSMEIEDIVIAYEPVWAIGTGVTAKPKQIEEAITYIRNNIAELYGENAAKNVHILYGAGVEPEFVGSILSLECGVDGLLVGGASLHYYKFAGIVAAAERVQNQRSKH